MNKLFPTYEIGSLPKLNARVKALKGQPVSDEDIQQIMKLSKRVNIDPTNVESIFRAQTADKRKLTPEEKSQVIDFNALLYLKLQKLIGFDFVYDGEARRAEMYRHVVLRIDGFEDIPEMVRSRDLDSYRKGICIADPKLKEGSLDQLVTREFDFVSQNVKDPSTIKVPIDDPYMIAVMSDNGHFTERTRNEFSSDLRRHSYEAKRAFTLALANNVIRPQVESVVAKGAQWVQLDIPAATLDLDHVPIVVEGVNAVVQGIENVKFSLHICYPRRVTLTEKNGYELLFPSILELNPTVNHLSLELANADQYEQDLAVFKEYQPDRIFEIGLGVTDITEEKQKMGVIETPGIVRDRIARAVDVLGDDSLVYVAPDCGLRQLELERCVQMYEILVKGTELARR